MKRYIIAFVAIAATLMLATGCGPKENIDEQFVAIENYIQTQNTAGIYYDGVVEYAYDKADGQCYLSPSELTFRIMNNTAKIIRKM